MKNYLVCVITLFALLVGCAPKTWHKDGASQGDYKRDKLACEKEANRAGYGHNVFNICMNSKAIALRESKPFNNKCNFRNGKA